jgi:hypothetical protein
MIERVNMAGMESPLACNLQAINVERRPRYYELAQRLRSALRDRTELADGYRYRIEADAITLPDLAEWIAMERLCCPFLSFHLDIANTGEVWIALRGPSIAKAILLEEFPAV